MFQAFLGPIASLASTFMEGRNEKIKANTRVKVATAEAEAKVMEKRATGEIEWDVEQAKASAGSWNMSQIMMKLVFIRVHFALKVLLCTRDQNLHHCR